MRPTERNGTVYGARALSDPMTIIPRFNDPSTVRRAASDLTNMVGPHNDCPDGGAIRPAPISSPPAGQIAAPIGHAEPLTELPSAPCVRPWIVAGDMMAVMMPVSNPGMSRHRDSAQKHCRQKDGP
jgi:hypothetical protein